MPKHVDTVFKCKLSIHQDMTKCPILSSQILHNNLLNVVTKVFECNKTMKQDKKSKQIQVGWGSAYK